MSAFTNTVRKLTVDECDRQKRAHDAKKADDIDRLGFSSSMSAASLWRIAGSAGRAVTWLEQLDAEHPDAEPLDLVEQLEMRIEDEISVHPRTFTVKHLHGVLAYARQTAAEQLVDNLMEAVGITPQPWQRAQVHAASMEHRPITSGVTVDEFSTVFDLLAIDGPLVGRVIRVQPWIRKVDVPIISSITRRPFVATYYVRPEGLVWRSWLRALEERQNAALIANLLDIPEPLR